MYHGLLVDFGSEVFKLLGSLIELLLEFIDVIAFGEELLLKLGKVVLQGEHLELFLVKSLFVEEKFLVGLLYPEIELLVFFLKLRLK